jgi:hypothetical protein
MLQTIDLGGSRFLCHAANHNIAAEAVWLGAVEAPDEAAAIQRGAAEFGVKADRLMAIRR